MKNGMNKIEVVVFQKTDAEISVAVRITSDSVYISQNTYSWDKNTTYSDDSDILSSDGFHQFVSDLIGNTLLGNMLGSLSSKEFDDLHGLFRMTMEVREEDSGKPYVNILFTKGREDDDTGFFKNSTYYPSSGLVDRYGVIDHEAILDRFMR